MSAFQQEEFDGAEDGLDDVAGTGELLGSKKGGGNGDDASSAGSEKVKRGGRSKAKDKAAGSGRV